MLKSQKRADHETLEIRKKIRKLTVLDNWHCIVYLAKDYFIIAVCIATCLKISMWLYPFAWILIGTRQRGLANILHAASHNTLARNRIWNLVAGTFLSGYLVGQKYVLYCYSHVTNHHGHLGDRSLDPDYKLHLSAGLYERKTQLGFIWTYIIKAFLGLKVPQYLLYVFRDRLAGKVPKKFDNKIISHKKDCLFFTSLWLGIISLALYFNFFHFLLLFWLIPLSTSAMIIGWFIEMAEHFPLVQVSKDKLYMTRNRNAGSFELFFTGVHFDNYHLEHHLNPNVPMWNLPKSQQVRLENEVYRQWDESWGGIFSRCDRKTTRQTFYQYIFSKEANVIASAKQARGAFNGQ